MKRVFLVLAFLFLSACGSSSKSGSPSIPHSSDGTEPLFFEQWAIHYDQAFYMQNSINKEAHIHAEKSMATYTGKGVKLAIIDIGFEVNHPEFRKNITHTFNSKDLSLSVECSHSQYCYHGTATTGVIASNVNQQGLRGIAPDVELILIQLALSADFLSDDEILNALDYAEKQGVDIINNSWGIDFVSPVIQDKIEKMARKGRDGKGIIFVFAAGNDGLDNKNDISMLDTVIGVGSTDEGNVRAIYSNYGRGLDMLAPGGQKLGITTTHADINTKNIDDYLRAEKSDINYNGSSASAAIVSASIALLLEKENELTKLEIEKRLYTTADKVGYLDYVDGKNDFYGYGKLNVDALLKNDREK